MKKIVGSITAMFQIPSSFSNENESYITLPAMKHFAKERRKEDLKTTVDRPELIQDIENFANRSQENQEVVLQWLDTVLKEGIKEVQIKYLDLELVQVELLREEKWIQEIFEPLLVNPDSPHLCNRYTLELRLYRYEYNQKEDKSVISLYLGKLISGFDKKNGAATTAYPILIDIYVDSGFITARGKSKSGMYNYMEEFVLETATTTTAEKELKKAIKCVVEWLGIQTKPAHDAGPNFRSCLFRMLDRYTKTPKEIVELIENSKEKIENLKDVVVKDICKLRYAYEVDVLSDINNMIEKYFSISFPDKSVFTKDRDAYPLKIMATDDEDSKLEQTAAMEEPLQSKAVFFDNKKMLQKSKLCDGVWFRFLRLDSTYFSKEFNVKIITKSDFCTLKFTEYTAEEDIQHVLFSLINS